MKKIIAALLLSFAVYATTIAQTTSAQPSASVSKQKNKANKEAIAAQKKTDKHAKVLEEKQAEQAGSTSVNQTTATEKSTVPAHKKHPRKQKR